MMDQQHHIGDAVRRQTEALEFWYETDNLVMETVMANMSVLACHRAKQDEYEKALKPRSSGIRHRKKKGGGGYFVCFEAQSMFT